MVVDYEYDDDEYYDDDDDDEASSLASSSVWEGMVVKKKGTKMTTMV